MFLATKIHDPFVAAKKRKNKKQECFYEKILIQNASFCISSLLKRRCFRICRL